MLNGSSVPYATVKLNEFEFIPNTKIIYLGHTTQKPLDMIPRYGKDHNFMSLPEQLYYIQLTHKCKNSFKPLNSSGYRYRYGCNLWFGFAVLSNYDCIHFLVSSFKANYGIKPHFLLSPINWYIIDLYFSVTLP
jgi:hypothetical protein